MADHDRPPGDEDARWYGPYGGPADNPAETGPDFQLPDQPFWYPAPQGVQPVQPLPPPRPERPERPRRRGAGILAAAVLLALVAGGAAGFGGAKLAEWTGPAASGSAPATTDPSDRTSDQPTDPPSDRPTDRPSDQSQAPIPRDPNNPQIDTVAVAKAVLPGTVMIRAGGSGSGQATGSGFVLDASGRIVTNNHVVDRAADGGRITVMFADGRRVNASLVGRSPSYDIAVLKVAPGTYLKPIPLGDSDASQVGEPVVAVGSPLGLAGSVTQGIISAKNRPLVVQASANADAPTAYINGIQTDAPINPGNSGGPLIDARGRVVGVNSAILTLSGENSTSGNIGLGFAIPIKQAAQIGNLLIKNGKATYPVIGADVGDSGDGVELESVESGGPAARAGLRAGDVVTSIDRRAVAGMAELIVAIRTHRPGERITLAYNRGTDRDSAVVTLGSRDG